MGSGGHGYRQAGFTVLYASLFAAVILSVTASIASIAQRQHQLSAFGYQSKVAYNAAASAKNCFMYQALVNDAFVDLPENEPVYVDCAYQENIEVFESRFTEDPFKVAGDTSYARVMVVSEPTLANPNAPVIISRGYNRNPATAGSAPVAQRVTEATYPEQVTSPSLSVSCEADPGTVGIGEDVTWTATPSGGSGSYAYEWSGAVSGFTQEETQSYSTEGTKTARVTVDDGSGTPVTSPDCAATVDDGGGGDGWAQVAQGSFDISCSPPGNDQLLNGSESVYTANGSVEKIRVVWSAVASTPACPDGGCPLTKGNASASLVGSSLGSGVSYDASIIINDAYVSGYNADGETFIYDSYPNGSVTIDDVDLHCSSAYGLQFDALGSVTVYEWQEE